ncbi:MAG: acyltransferase [Actinobacteria bacterium]|nr:acyltransferase [Actinomycetota bacterium]MBI3686600.1 acyltransferase [Actinomycetota bacterium]
MSTLLAMLGRVLDPATWVHLVKLANYYGYAHVQPRKRLTAGPGLRMAPNASLRNGERITLGREVHVGERCCLWAGDSAGRITLGDHALLGPEVFITASNYQLAPGTPVMYQAKREQDVVIGADVWLGARVVVLPGVTIGDGAIVGAGAVVSRDLPAGCIAVGAPAKVVAWRDGRPAGARDARPAGAEVGDADPS